MRFTLFHVNVIPDDNAGLFGTKLIDDEKNQLIVDSIHQRKFGIHWNQKYQFWDIKSNNDIVWGYIAHPDVAEIAQPDESREHLQIEERDTWDWTHFVYLGSPHQILAVMDKTDFFSGSILGMSKLLQSVLLAGLDNIDSRGHTFIVNSITDKTQFWTIVENAEKIYSLQFDLVVPNAHGGADELETFLEKQNTKHNATNVTSKISNRNGRLSISKHDKEIVEEIDYASSGSGRTKLIYKNANEKTRRWTSDSASTSIEADLIQTDGATIDDSVDAIANKIKKSK